MSHEQTPHHETSHQGDSHAQDINVPVILTVGVISSILLAVIIIGIQAWFQYEMQQERQAKIIEAVDPELQSLNNAAASKLKGGQWADADRQRVTLSIDRAMNQVSQRYRSASEAERGSLFGGPGAAGAASEPQTPTTEPVEQPAEQAE